MRNFLFLFLLALSLCSFKGSSFLTIGNLVWNDANGNGIKEAFEPGVGGVTVKLYLDNDNNNIPDGPGFGTIVSTTTTAANGSYFFNELDPGRYIVSLIIPAGYIPSPTFSLTPDNNINNDNNAAILFNNQSEIRSNAITISSGAEPTNDGDGTEGNLTLDLAVCGQSDIGDFVWFDRNANGLQDPEENGFANTSVILIYPDGTTYQKFTDANGKYSFVNLGPGTHTLNFATPIGFTPSPALVGSNRQIDSDPVGGLVTLTVLPITNNLSYDAGFYLQQCTAANDTDGDCIADLDDLDDDNDGVIDDVENNGYDALKDCDSDGVVNFRDPTPGCPTRTGNNVYGEPFKPLVWLDCNTDGINDFFDWDKDGIINELDLDSDNDGIIDIQETRDGRARDNNNDGMADGIDEDGDGILSSADVNDLVYGGPGLQPADLDRDGNPNYLDLDSDGDGVVDITEALLFVDSDGLVNGTDSDKDGVLTIVYNNNNISADNFNGFGAKGIRVDDNDQDGFPNPYDIDDDNDGITDNVEAQPTCVEVQPFGIDTDKDGLDDAYDIDNNACRFKAHGITPYDKDGDGTPDMYDLDTDNDGAPDFNEGSGIQGDFVTNYDDTDGDGLIDQYDIFNIKSATTLFVHNVAHSNMGPNGSFDGPVPAGSSPQLPQQASGNCSTGADRDWRDISVLPVSLVEFKGRLIGSQVQLTWLTTNEVNMQHYIVERSLNGVTYTAIGKVEAKGNAIRNEYALTDNVTNQKSGMLYYRLRQVDKTLLFKMSGVIFIKALGKDVSTVHVLPNPASSYFTLNVSVPRETQAVVRIVDQFGRIVKIEKRSIKMGLNTINFSNLSAIPAGNYNVQIIMADEILTKKIVIIGK